MPAHNSTGQKPEARLTRILAALCKREGGSLRIKGADIDSIDKEISLVFDWDTEAQELVVRSGTRFVEIYRVQPEAAAWTQPTQAAIATPPSSPSAAAAPSTLDNSKLAGMERTLLKRRVAALLKQELNQRHRQEADLLQRAGVPDNS